MRRIPVMRMKPQPAIEGGCMGCSRGRASDYHPDPENQITETIVFEVITGKMAWQTRLCRECWQAAIEVIKAGLDCGDGRGVRR